MIVCSCRSLIRLNFARKPANSYNLPANSLYSFHGSYEHHRELSFFIINTMDRTKKQKTSKPVWRPISTQSISHQGLNSGVRVVQCSSSSAVSEIEDFSKNGEQLSGVAELSISTVTEIEEESKVENVQFDNETGKHSVSVEVAASLMRFIKGKGESTQKLIEDETGTKLIFPLFKQENSIVIEGISSESIFKASEKIQVILEEKVSSKVVDALEGKPISVRLNGLECMKGPLAKARVLYTPVEVIGGEGRLLRACQVVTDAFIEAGLVLEKDARQKLKLHGTVMNARHRKSKQRTKKRFDSFDARSVVEKYGSEDWGEYVIPEVHLSQRFAFDEKGYYHCCAKISFPENEHVE